MKNVTLIIVFIIAAGGAITALSCLSGDLSLGDCFANLLTPEIATFLVGGGIVAVILLVIYIALSDYFRTKPFWMY